MKKAFSAIGDFIKTPAGVIITTDIVWHSIVWAAGIPINFIASGVVFVVDLLAAFYLVDRLTYFYAQFVLPVKTPKQRQELYARVRSIESGRGPTMFVKNGRVIKHEGEAEKRGPGVIFLDTASALVLRTETEIRDTVGPGVKFTRGNEFVAGSVDLRAQWQFIGPLSTEHLFLKPAPITTPQQYNELQMRRQQTSGLTRDGFEISPTISIKFRIKRPVELVATETGVTSRYGYDPEAVRNAVTKEIVKLGTAKKSATRMEWKRLPAHLVVNLWREYIRKFKLSDLFTSDASVSGLQTIEDMINKRLKKERVVILDDTGIPTGEWVPSMEWRQLDQRGLEVLEVRIHNLMFDPVMEEQIIQQWKTEWLNIAKKEEAQIKEMASLAETAARAEAGKNFARIAAQMLSTVRENARRNPFTTLQMLIQPLRDFLIAESGPGNETETELRKLEDIWKWLLDNNPNQSQGNG